MKVKLLILVLLYYIGLFVVLPFLFIYVGSSFQISALQDPAVKIIGVGMVTLGIINSVYCYRLFFKKGAGSPFATQPTQKFIIDGLFKYTRNPLYLGQFIILLGEFFWLGNYTLLVYFFGFVTTYHFLVIPQEEAKNDKRFGEVYRVYKKSTPRYL